VGARGEDANGTRLERVRRLVRYAPRAIETALRVLEGESVRLRAMALTYISLFALVPGLVVAFSVVEAFTGMDRISGRVHEFLLDNLAVGARTTLEPYLDRFIQNAHATSAGLVGGFLLVWSAVSLFSNVEGALNDIWGIRRRRPLAQRAVIYWVGLTLGPLLLASSVTLSAATRTWLAGQNVRVLAVLAGWLLTSLFLAVLYQIVPWTRVKILPAVAGGLVAGLAWEIAKWGYTLLLGRFVRFHAIYGSVAAVPTFILWLYVSWTILLFGARLAFVFQYAPTLLSGAGPTSKAGREILAGEAMLRVALAYDRNEDAPDAGDLGTALGAMAEDVGEALLALRQSGLVLVLADGGLVPARPLEQLSLLDVRRAVSGPAPALSDGRSVVGAIVKGAEDLAGERLAAVTLRSLCDRARDAGGRDASEAIGRAVAQASSPSPTRV
jgi:membrane protein